MTKYMTNKTIVGNITHYRHAPFINITKLFPTTQSEFKLRNGQCMDKWLNTSISVWLEEVGNVRSATKIFY